MKPVISVKPYHLGIGQPCFIIAEAGVNHNGQLELAKQLVDVAVQAGVHAIKFQTFKAEKLIATTAPKAAYQQKTTDSQESQLDMVKKLELSFAAFTELKTYCDQQGILFLSTPFDEDSADFLAELGMPAFKIPSGEVTNLPFLEYLARKGKPIILSTGMAYLGEVETACHVLEQAGCQDIILLHCTSNYPTDPTEVNLRAMITMGAALQRPIGYSDHTLGIEIALAAVAMGACVIEKHFTLDKAMPGPDHQASLDPHELTALVQGIQKIEAALGHGRKIPAPSERNTAEVARRSLVAAYDIPAGTVLTAEMIALKRPGTGLAPAMRPYFIGRTTRQAISKDTLLDLAMLI